ncbi:long-chain-fatty-acid--CoA ligase [Caldifermentibacillus hisashii]|uniref:Long-chain-fatty-acid--CoA ligase n=1 Tax=Caldibacillus thermoamylovorans TaxID=35841 RepID=A0ABD4A1Q0_9BACI|nr:MULTISPECIES: long-chain-fatty-acid--CoA ligase [Bacillaceae]KIO61015.1 Long-chain-fatty-acid--CoA ligase [Caldibacillus thermoamylovorans]KIO70108.1 Long-chain-fatty-acid--CoA ligase [Caldibacillus thermoamylovorans]MEC5270800.1 long-chain-fatty-acid--CoA ligase [Caldifermentibacillus hisashii]MED4851240.1 long-chain-fatty-acid--CoA ligase [Caldifermentibacillus hisashii]PAC36955.1 long-chain fatty acid--CoA ligase [Caldifermentibacillus hisashii]
MENKPWLKHYPPQIPHTLTFEETSLQQLLKNTAEKYPNKIAIHFNGKELSYKELYESALKFAGYLQKIGIQKGDRVAIMLPNTPQSVISFYGVMMAGGIVVQTNPMYTERELAFQMKDSGAKAIVALDILFPRIKKIQGETELEHIIITVIKDYLPFPKNLVYPFIQKKQYGFSVKVEHKGNDHLFTEIMKHPALQEPIMNINFEEDLAILQYTGGTTGFPKGVMLTHKNLIANTKMCQAWLYKCREGEEIVLGALPFFHVYGMTTVMILSILQASKMVLIPKPDPEVLLKTIQSQRPTMFPGAPTMYIGMLNHPELSKYDLSSIDSCISGSAPLPVEVQEQFERLTGGKLVEGYGLTESSPVTHANLLWDGERVKGSIGLPWPDTLAEIRSVETGEPLPVGEIGELVVKGPQVMKGYWNRPEETQEVLKDGWLHTGDMGYMDEEGYFYIVDRKKDMIIASGYNIYPREIEEVLYEHPAVKEVVVAGVPDPYRGETVKAYIVLKEGTTVTEDELNKFARKNLAAYKVPRKYEFRDELPKTTVGKILRRQLVEEEKRKLNELNEKKA